MGDGILAVMRMLRSGALFLLLALPAAAASIPFIDLSRDIDRQVVVDREKDQYLGHVTTCLLDDGKTMLAVYPKGHGRGAIVYKRSTDGGLTWSDRLPTPESWATSMEVPTLHRMTGPDGKKRIIMWSGLYPARLAVTEDEGKTWSELNPAGDWGGIVVMGTHVELKTGKGHYACFFHDDGRFFAKGGKRRKPAEFRLYQTNTVDGGLTWSFPKIIWQGGDIHLCEPGAVRSPDGKTIALLLRENARVKNSHVIFSKDEGETWSEPRELPISLCGDRHTAKYTPDGRLVIAFRGITPGKRKVRSDGEAVGPLPTAGDCAAWVGRWEDIVEGKPGEMILRLLDNKKSYDTTYPGVELLPDGNIVVTTYGHWEKGEEPFIKSIRFTMAELDGLMAKQVHRILLSDDGKKVAEAPVQAPVMLLNGGAEVVEGEKSFGGYAQFREQTVLQTKSGRLVLVAQGRNPSKWSDRSGQDLVVKTSDDAGKTWGKARMIATHGADSICPNAIVYDAKSDKIHALYNLFCWDFRKPPVRGETGKQECRQYQITSSDNGETWTEPRDITDQIDIHDATVVFGSGEGIQLKRGQHSGRLVVPGGHFKDGKAVCMYLSDDGGKTWRRGKDVPLPQGMSVQSETKVAELPDGSLILNNRASGMRRQSYSQDGGETWKEMTLRKDLPAVSCNGSLLAVQGGGEYSLLCSFPAGPKRTHGGLFVSRDKGATWKLLRIVEPGEFAYSSLLQVGDEILVFYETRGHRDIVMRRFGVGELLGGG